MKVTVASRNIGKVIKRLEAYRDSISSKMKEFIQKLADRGINAAMFSLAEGIGDTPKDVEFGIKFTDEGNPIVGVLRGASDNPEDLLFWEFGAGSEFNGMSSPNPKAKEFGMGPGTYPGQTHVPHPGFWYYRDENGLHKSYGTKAAMPMFNASVEMFNSIEEVAREVFGG